MPLAVAPPGLRLAAVMGILRFPSSRFDRRDEGKLCDAGITSGKANHTAKSFSLRMVLTQHRSFHRSRLSTAGAMETMNTYPNSEAQAVAQRKQRS